MWEHIVPIDTDLPQIRRLAARDDSQAVLGLYERAADFVLLETGSAPSGTTVDQFFSDCPPGGDLAASCKLGMFMPDGELVAIADLAFGYPETDDAYLGLLLFAPQRRGLGLGRIFLEHIEAIAKARNAKRLLIAVLEENVRGRSFWEREGFHLIRSFSGFEIGRKTHTVHRMWRPL